MERQENAIYPNVHPHNNGKHQVLSCAPMIMVLNRPITPELSAGIWVIAIRNSLAKL